MTNTIKVCREEKTITQDILAKSIGVSRRSIISIENGQSIPSVDIAMKISQVLEVPIDQLFIVENENIQLAKHILFIDLFLACRTGRKHYFCPHPF